jgi:hypothetical protein
LQIKEKLLALKKRKKDIKFIWIPAHMAIVLKETGDGSAKESIRKGEDAQYLIPVRLEELLEDQTESSIQGIVL